MMYERYVLSEVHPISVLDMDTGDSYPINDGIGFAEDMCKLLNNSNNNIQYILNTIDKEIDTYLQKIKKVDNTPLIESDIKDKKIHQLNSYVMVLLHLLKEIEKTLNQ